MRGQKVQGRGQRKIQEVTTLTKTVEFQQTIIFVAYNSFFFII